MSTGGSLSGLSLSVVIARRVSDPPRSRTGLFFLRGGSETHRAKTQS